MSPDEIRSLERVQANAWPAAVAEVVDGWELRFTWGVSRRANCVWTGDAEGRVAVGEKLAAAEDFYERHGGSARFLISPTVEPADLEPRLADRGYTIDAPTLLQTAALGEVAARLGERESAPNRDVSLVEQYDEAWYTAYRGVLESQEPENPRREILRRIQPRAVYVRLDAAGQTVAVGSAVAEGTWLGIFNVATAAAFRRQGAARTIMRGLADWGLAQGATQAYLQVTETNAPAVQLYERLGFATDYRYYYRVKHPT